MRFVIIGSTVVDLFFHLAKNAFRQSMQTRKIELPFDEKILADGYDLFPGGSGANVAIALKKLGHEPQLISGVGDDVLGEYLRDHIKALGVVGELAKESGPTPTSVILKIASERMIVTSTNHLPNYINQPLPENGWIHLGPLPTETDSFYSRLISHQVKTEQPVSINPKLEALQERQRGLMNLLRTTKVLFLNRTEARTLARLPQANEEELVVSLTHIGPEIVVVTSGQRGAYVGNREVQLHASALDAGEEELDATGAGDAFIAGFLAGFHGALSTHRDELEQIEAGLRYGIAESGSTVRSLGAQSGQLSAQQIAREAEYVRVRRVNDNKNNPTW